jgi:putative oxidoreductase
MAAGGSSKWRTIAVWALRIIVGLTFLFVGTTKLTGTGQTVEYFTAIGWGQWFRYVTGLLDFAAGLLLFVPGWTPYAALVLTCNVGLATVLSLTVLHGDPRWGSSEMVVVPLVLTGLAAALAWLTRTRRIH